MNAVTTEPVVIDDDGTTVIYISDGKSFDQHLGSQDLSVSDAESYMVSTYSSGSEEPHTSDQVGLLETAAAVSGISSSTIQGMGSNKNRSMHVSQFQSLSTPLASDLSFGSPKLETADAGVYNERQVDRMGQIQVDEAPSVTVVSEDQHKLNEMNNYRKGRILAKHTFEKSVYSMSVGEFCLCSPEEKGENVSEEQVFIRQGQMLRLPEVGIIRVGPLEFYAFQVNKNWYISTDLLYKELGLKVSRKFQQCLKSFSGTEEQFIPLRDNEFELLKQKSQLKTNARWKTLISINMIREVCKLLKQNSVHSLIHLLAGGPYYRRNPDFDLKCSTCALKVYKESVPEKFISLNMRDISMKMSVGQVHAPFLETRRRDNPSLDITNRLPIAMNRPPIVTTVATNSHTIVTNPHTSVEDIPPLSTYTLPIARNTPPMSTNPIRIATNPTPIAVNQPLIATNPPMPPPIATNQSPILTNPTPIATSRHLIAMNPPSIATNPPPLATNSLLSCVVGVLSMEGVGLTCLQLKNLQYISIKDIVGHKIYSLLYLQKVLNTLKYKPICAPQEVEVQLSKCESPVRNTLWIELESFRLVCSLYKEKSLKQKDCVDLISCMIRKNFSFMPMKTILYEELLDLSQACLYKIDASSMRYTSRDSVAYSTKDTSFVIEHKQQMQSKPRRGSGMMQFEISSTTAEAANENMPQKEGITGQLDTGDQQATGSKSRGSKRREKSSKSEQVKLSMINEATHDPSTQISKNVKDTVEKTKCVKRKNVKRSRKTSKTDISQVKCSLSPGEYIIRDLSAFSRYIRMTGCMISESAVVTEEDQTVSALHNPLDNEIMFEEEVIEDNYYMGPGSDVIPTQDKVTMNVYVEDQYSGVESVDCSNVIVEMNESALKGFVYQNFDETSIDNECMNLYGQVCDEASTTVASLAPGHHISSPPVIANLAVQDASQEMLESASSGAEELNSPDISMSPAEEELTQVINQASHLSTVVPLSRVSQNISEMPDSVQPTQPFSPDETALIDRNIAPESITDKHCWDIDQIISHTGDIHRSTSLTWEIDRVTSHAGDNGRVASNTGDIGRSTSNTGDISRSTSHTGDIGSVASHTRDIGRVTSHTGDIHRSTSLTWEIDRVTSHAGDNGRVASNTGDIGRSTSHTGDIGRSTSHTGDIDRSTSLTWEIDRVTSHTGDNGRVASLKGDIGRVTSHTGDNGRVASLKGDIGRVTSHTGDIGRSTSHIGEIGIVASHTGDIGRVASHTGDIGRGTCHIGEIGIVASHTGDIGRVASHTRDIGRVTSHIGEIGIVASHTGGIGRVASHTGDIGRGTCHTGDIDRVTSHTGDIGRVASHTGDIDRGTSHTGDIGRVASHTGDIGRVASHTGDIGRVASHTWDIGRGTCHTGDIGRVANHTGDIGRVASHTGDIGRVASHTGDIGRVASHTGDIGRVASHTGDIGRGTCHTGDIGRSISDTGDIDREASHTGDIGRVASHTGDIGRVASHTGDIDRVTSHTGDIGRVTSHTGDIGRVTSHTGDNDRVTSHIGDIGRVTSHTRDIGRSISDTGDIDRSISQTMIGQEESNINKIASLSEDRLLRETDNKDSIDEHHVNEPKGTINNLNTNVSDLLTKNMLSSDSTGNGTVRSPVKTVHSSTHVILDSKTGTDAGLKIMMIISKINNVCAVAGLEQLPKDGQVSYDKVQTRKEEVLNLLKKCVKFSIHRDANGFKKIRAKEILPGASAFIPNTDLFRTDAERDLKQTVFLSAASELICSHYGLDVKQITSPSQINSVSRSPNIHTVSPGLIVSPGTRPQAGTSCSQVISHQSVSGTDRHPMGGGKSAEKINLFGKDNNEQLEKKVNFSSIDAGNDSVSSTEHVNEVRSAENQTDNTMEESEHAAHKADGIINQVEMVEKCSGSVLVKDKCDISVELMDVTENKTDNENINKGEKVRVKRGNKKAVSETKVSGGVGTSRDTGKLAVNVQNTAPVINETKKKRGRPRKRNLEPETCPAPTCSGDLSEARDQVCSQQKRRRCDKLRQLDSVGDNIVDHQLDDTVGVGVNSSQVENSTSEQSAKVWVSDKVHAKVGNVESLMLMDSSSLNKRRKMYRSPHSVTSRSRGGLIEIVERTVRSQRKMKHLSQLKPGNNTCEGNQESVETKKFSPRIEDDVGSGHRRTGVADENSDSKNKHFETEVRRSSSDTIRKRRNGSNMLSVKKDEGCEKVINRRGISSPYTTVKMRDKNVRHESDTIIDSINRVVRRGKRVKGQGEIHKSVIKGKGETVHTLTKEQGSPTEDIDKSHVKTHTGIINYHTVKGQDDTVDSIVQGHTVKGQDVLVDDIVQGHTVKGQDVLVDDIVQGHTVKGQDVLVDDIVQGHTVKGQDVLVDDIVQGHTVKGQDVLVDDIVQGHTVKGQDVLVDDIVQGHTVKDQDETDYNIVKGCKVVIKRIRFLDEAVMSQFS